MRATSSLTPSDNARNNRLMSESGKKKIDNYIYEISQLFKIAGREDMLDSIIREMKKSPDAEATENLSNDDATEDWPGMPTSEI